ncbi:hypothetical protein L2E82_43377 [Cichorium intybus]|uniref:Uncharacterized protein n=1 Tax=Cichorium intybus TaxID=13427 RepID=A0ACB8ZPT2_CICIN|nr:hypothetical protein L1887_30983 [Cichorium endivia]KAI3699228.1 hypothetical protein L2E82_43377 [Cichorium intybus]
MDADRYTFCSIACKYRITTGKPITKPKPHRPPPDKGPDQDNGPDTDTNIDRRVNVHRKKSLTGTGRRKGIPMRAPLY